MRSCQLASVPLSYQRLAFFTGKQAPLSTGRKHTGPRLLSVFVSLNVRNRPASTMKSMTKIKNDHMGTFCWLSVQQVCDRLGISTSTFYKWRASQKGPRAKRLPNGELRVREDWLNEFMSELPEEVA
jgi:predicted DNA-binding transcriptional regulator AlpA